MTADSNAPIPSAQCVGDPGECTYNGACMYACEAQPISDARIDATLRELDGIAREHGHVGLGLNDPSEFEAMREVVRAVATPVVPQWLPIETAPKDVGILVTNGKDIACVWWRDGGLPEYPWLMANDVWLAAHPTHWQPLPTAPAQDRDSTDSGQALEAKA